MRDLVQHDWSVMSFSEICFHDVLAQHCTLYSTGLLGLACQESFNTNSVRSHSGEVRNQQEGRK